jgi:hypothetical protein
MQKNLRVQVIQNLYAEVRKSRTGDLSRAVDFLKKARDVKKQVDKADLPFWW